LQLETRIAMGIPVQPGEFDATWRGEGHAVRGHGEGPLEEQRTVTDLLKKPPAEQAAYVSQLEQNLMTKGEGNPKIVARLKQTVGNTIKMLGTRTRCSTRWTAAARSCSRSTWRTRRLAGEPREPHAGAARPQQKQVGGGLGALMPQEAARSRTR
jgi:hypothetical protein